MLGRPVWRAVDMSPYDSGSSKTAPKPEDSVPSIDIGDIASSDWRAVGSLGPGGREDLHIVGRYVLPREHITQPWDTRGFEEYSAINKLVLHDMHVPCTNTVPITEIAPPQCQVCHPG